MRTHTTIAGLAAVGLLTGCSGQAPTQQSTQAPTEQPPMTQHAADEAAQQPATDTSAPSAPSAPSVRGVAFEMADGSPASMDQFAGTVVLVVNVASQCGLTPQVAGLQALHEANKDRGFTVLAFPSASFNQEPLDSAQAAQFCSQMGATYPVAAKVPVKGDAAHDLFAHLARQGGEPNWNFTKYLVDKQGNVVQRFDPRTAPDDPAIQQAIDRALAG